MPPEGLLIQSRHNPQFKHWQRLQTQASYRREQQQTLLEGLHLLLAMQTSAHSPLQLIYASSAANHPDLASFCQHWPQTERFELADALWESLTAIPAAQGVMAGWQPATPQPLALSSNWLVLDDVQDPGNLGSILRTAAAAGVQDVLLTPGCADVWSPKVLRAGMGAHFQLNIHYRVPVAELLQSYAGQVIVTALQQSQNLYQTALNGPCAWLFGNEGAGVSAELAALAQLRIKIPMQAETESLNVGAAVAVCLFEQMRQQQYAVFSH
jgi:TrmH family RNA methyltransferase